MTTSIEVIINGERYIKAPPALAADEASRIEEVLSAPIQYELGQGTIRDYLYELLKAVWREGESFSGKRPFGNSGWEHDLYEALARAGVIEAEFDEHDDLDELSGDSKRLANQLIFQAIAYVFYGNQQ